jgi:hypothetical protein
MAADKFITRSQAFARVSKALLSQLSEHIRPPTKRENELLEEFGHGPVYQPGTRFLGGAGYNPFAKIEQGEDYAAVQDAQRRHRDWKWHGEKVDDWLSARGFNGKHFDLTAFEKAFDTCFAVAAVGTDPPSAPARLFDLPIARPFGGPNPSRRDDRISDPIPDDGIGLAEARKKWLRALVPNFDALDEKAEHAIQERLKGERVFEADQALQAVANEQAAEHLKADIIVRKVLIAGEITGLILNDRGDLLKLAAADWVVDSGIDSHRDADGTMVSVEVPNAGFAAADDYVWPGAVERSGPETRLSGSSRPDAHRRVFFQQRDFAALLEQHVLDDESALACGLRRGAESNDEPAPPPEISANPEEKTQADTDRPAGAESPLTNQAQIGTRSRYAVALDLWTGQKAETVALNKAVAAHLAALKSAITREQETALRDLETGKGSTLATAKMFRSAPHVLAMLTGTPLIQKVRELVQILNAPDEWNGFFDAYWTIGQTVLWRLTRDSEVVDEASNDCGRLGDTWGQVKAAVLFDTLNLPRERVQDAADELRRRCLDGRVTAIDGQNRLIPAIEWRYLKIVLDTDNVPSVLRRGQSSIVPAYPDVVFSRVEVLPEFPPGHAEAEETVPRPGSEPPALHRTGLTKKSAKEKDADALEIARRFVDDDRIAPNYKAHASQVMRELRTKYPDDHIGRKNLEPLLQTSFKRREPGEKANKRKR